MRGEVFSADLVRDRARLSPDRTALIEIRSGARLRYQELDRRVDAAAHLLAALGIGHGDRFGVLMHNRIELVELFFAATRSRSIAVPLSTRATAHELEAIVRDSGLQVLVFGPEFAEIASELTASLSIRAIPVEGGSESEPSWASLSAVAPDEPFPAVFGDPEDVCCLLYTSGTTGRPKGVMIPHRMIVWNAYNTAVCWGLRQDDVTPIFTPMYHAGGLTVFLTPIFAVGGTVILHEHFDAVEVLETIQREQCTVALGVPTVFQLIAETPEFDTIDFTSVRWLISGGAPLPIHLVERYRERGIVLKQGFGMTEVGVNCFAMGDDEAVLKAGSVGRPMLFTRVRLVDEEGLEVPAGEVGEMQIRGSHVSRGYWNNEDATREAYLPEGWFRTGDFARRDDDGFFFIAGRRKEMFISGGVNVYPAEIELELLQHPAVADAAVVGVEDATWGEVGVGFVVLVSGESIEESELREFLISRISKYKVPKTIRLVDQLPRNAYGKIVRGELRKLWLSESPSR